MVSGWILTKESLLGMHEVEDQSGDIEKVLAVLWAMENPHPSHCISRGTGM